MSSGSPDLNDVGAELAHEYALRHFRIAETHFVRGIDNVYADALSRVRTHGVPPELAHVRRVQPARLSWRALPARAFK